MAKSDKPNILVIWGDDTGQSNLSCYSHGVMQPFLSSFKEFPPRQKAASFTLDRALEKMAEAFNSGH